MQTYLRVSPVEPRGNEGGEKTTTKRRVAVLRGRLASPPPFFFWSGTFSEINAPENPFFLRAGVLNSKQLEFYNSYSPLKKVYFAASLTDNR